MSGTGHAVHIGNPMCIGSIACRKISYGWLV